MTTETKEKQLYLKLKESYPFTCWNCSKEFMAKPSIFMEGMQMNWGGGRCPACGADMLLTINSDNETMQSTQRTEEAFGEAGAQLPDACYTDQVPAQRSKE